MNKFNKLYNVIMEDLEAEYMDADFSEPFDLEGFKKRQAEWHKPKNDDFVFDETSDGYQALYEEFVDSLEFDISCSVYTEQIMDNIGDFYDFAKFKFQECIEDPTVREALKKYINDPEGKTDAYDNLQDAIHYWIVEKVMVDLETEVVSSENEES